MPELQIDVTVANRFISSLSKSLQALCHGCMDFDSGIEIVGYINVNIDSGSKVDYVLNEKVLKSTTNSMTFVSNSFLAKKEQQKQTHDSCCSPIPQAQVTPYPSRMRGQLHNSPYHRTSSQFTSQVPRGSQKRPRTDDWRSPKRHRNQNIPGEAQSFSDQNSSPTQSYSDNNFKQPHVPPSTSDSTSLLQMNIKKEILETDNNFSATDAEQTPDEQSEDQTYDSSYDTDKVQIKHDPDGAKSGTSNVANNENTDFKNTFLEPSSPNETQNADEEDNSELDNQLSEYEQGSQSASTDKIFTDEANVASTSNANLGDSSSSFAADAAEDTTEDYNQAPEDMSYSQSGYDDAGEGSSDAGQFEVIEIDDEDEDVQAMFGGTRNHKAGQKSNSRSSFYQAPSMYHQYPYVQNHSNLYVPFHCTICGKGFKSRGGLSFHMEAHKGRQFVCSVCDFKFKHKHHMKNHLIHVHKLLLCPSCCATFNHDEVNEHIAHVVSCRK